MKNNIQKGIIYGLIASIISGIAIFYAKISVTKIDSLVLTTSRNSIAALLLITSYLLLGRKENFKTVSRYDFGKLIFIGILGGGIPFCLFFSGLKLVESAIIANLIQKTLFIWVGLLALVFLKEKLNWKYWISFFLIIIANFYFARLPLKFGKGEIMILIATLLWSVENIIAKKVLKNISPHLVGVFRMVIGSFFLLLFILLTGKFNSLLTINNYQLTTIFIGGLILFFYVFFWLKALKYAPVSLVSLVLTFSTVVGNILNGSFSRVKIINSDVISSVLITFAIFLVFFKLKSQNSNVKTIS